MRERAIAAPLALVSLVASLAACAPSPTTDPIPAPTRTPVRRTDASLDGVRFTDDQLKAFLAAGLEIQKGVVPSRTLAAPELAALAEIGRTLWSAVCPPTGTAESCARHGIDVPRCIDRAGEIVGWRARERDAVDRELFVAAMGVSVTGREFPTFANLVRFCQEMARLDRPSASPSPPRS